MPEPMVIYFWLKNHTCPLTGVFFVHPVLGVHQSHNSLESYKSREVLLLFIIKSHSPNIQCFSVEEVEA